MLLSSQSRAQENRRAYTDTWAPRTTLNSPSPLIAPRDRSNNQNGTSSTATPANEARGFAVFDTAPAQSGSFQGSTTRTGGTVTFQQPMPGQSQPQLTNPSQRQGGEEALEYQIQLQPPGPQRLFQLESESRLHERMRQEARERPVPERILFPDEPVVAGGPTHPRPFPPNMMFVEPNYTCYGRLGFEQKNFERYGWDLCFMTPFVSGLAFYYDLATLPIHAFTCPFRKCDCSAGYCLPGDPVPLLCYPPEITVTGVTAEAALVVGLIAVF
jgi:hypothetical protein